MTDVSQLSIVMNDYESDFCDCPHVACNHSLLANKL